MKLGRKYGLLTLALVIAAAVPFAAAAQVHEVQYPGLVNPELIAENGVVASAHPLASEAGREMLEKGGNAIDAAVATGFALGVVEPFASGLGGEGVMLIYLAEEDEIIAIDYKGTAPANVPLPEEYDRERYGPTAPCVPGTPAGLAYVLEKYGTMSLAEVLEPAIRYAREGFEVGPLLFELLAVRNEHMNDAAREVFLPEYGAPPLVGEKLYQDDLANTLEKIAEYGVEYFYWGRTAWLIDQYMEENGGYITYEDMISYEPIEREPVVGDYRGYTVVSVPPPVSGLVVINMLNILEGFDLNELYNDSQVDYYHLLAEAFKIAYADYYAYIIDPAFGTTPVDELTSEEYAEMRRELIDMEEAQSGWEGGLGDIDIMESAALEAVAMSDGSTTHFVAGDAQGNIVSATHTISLFVGSQHVIPGTGVLMNNTLGLFTNDPDDIGRIEPGKRTRSMLVPTMVLDEDQPFMALGTPGATRIPSTLVMTLINIIDHEMGLQEAIEANRMTCLISWMHIEGRIEEGVAEGLGARGHPVRVRDGFDEYFGGVQALMWRDGVYHAGADPRREGAAAGY